MDETGRHPHAIGDFGMDAVGGLGQAAEECEKVHGIGVGLVGPSGGLLLEEVLLPPVKVRAAQAGNGQLVGAGQVRHEPAEGNDGAADLASGAGHLADHLDPGVSELGNERSASVVAGPQVGPTSAPLGGEGDRTDVAHLRHSQTSEATMAARAVGTCDW